jgi:hypothetical protein
MSKEQGFMDRLYLRKAERTREINNYVSGDRLYEAGTCRREIDVAEHKLKSLELLWLDQTICLYIDSLKPDPS